MLTAANRGTEQWHLIFLAWRLIRYQIPGIALVVAVAACAGDQAGPSPTDAPLPALTVRSDATARLAASS